MTELKKVDTLLKRYLKGRFSVNQALVVAFLITGAVSFAGEVVSYTPEEEAYINFYKSNPAATYAYKGSAPTMPSIVTPTATGIPTVPVENLTVGKRDYGVYNDGTVDLTDCNGVANNGNYGVFANNGAVTNAGAVGNYGNYGIVSTGAGAGVTNAGTVENFGDYGIYSTGLVTNSGTVANSGNYGIVANGAAVTNEAEGIVQNSGDYGIVSTGAGAGVTNSGTVANIGNYGIYSEGAVTNELTIKNTGNYGLVSANGTATNSASGTIENGGNYGMVVLEGTATNEGTIANGGDVGVYANNSAITNSGTIANKGNVGVFLDGTSSLINTGTIAPVNGSSNPTIAILSGEGNNDISLGTGSEVTGALFNTGGTDTLNLNGTGTLSSDVLNYSYIIGEGTAETPAARATLTGWTLSGNSYLLPGSLLGANVNSTVEGVDKLFVPIENIGTPIGTNIILEGTAEAPASVAMIIGRDKDLSKGTTLAAPAIYAQGYEIGDNATATHRNITLDRTFITSANKMEATIVYTNDGITVGGQKLAGTVDNPTILDADQVQELTDAGVIVTENVYTPGWTPSYTYDGKNLTLVLDRNDVLGGNSLSATEYGVDTVAAPGGYDVNNYPHSNLDVINARKITDKGYMYARKAAFMKPDVTMVQETVQYPAAPMDKGVKAQPVVTEKGKEVVAAPMIEEVVETKVYKNYDNLQFAEVFGDWGKYSGSGAEFDFDTYGVTGATYHRFDPNWLGGLSYGYAHSKVDYKSSNGSEEKLDTLGINAFLSYQWDNWLITGQGGYSWSRHDLDRKLLDYDAQYLTGDLLKRKASKKFDSNLGGVGFEIGYNYVIDETASLYPYVGFDYIWRSADSYTEKSDGYSGDSAFGGNLTLDKYTVSVDKDKYNTASTKLGVMGEKTYEKWTFTGDVAWIHYFSDYDNITGKYVDAAERGEDVYFKANKLNPGKDVAYVTLGADYAVNSQFTVGAEYTGYYRSKEAGSQFGLNMTYKF